MSANRMCSLRKVLLLATILVVGYSVAAFAAPPQTLSIGFVSTDPADIMAKQTVIADYLAKSLKDVGIEAAKIVTAASVEEIASLINAGKVDVFIDTVVPTIIVRDKTGMNVVLRRWKKGSAEYKTLFIAKKDSPLKDLSSLNGRRVGFEDVTSTSARWVPQSMLLRLGYKLAELETPASVVPKDRIGFTFTQAVENTPVWIAEGKIDVGCISTTDFQELPVDQRQSLKIIGESSYMPRQLVSFRKTLDSKVSQALKSLFLAMDQTTEGKDVLKKWEKTAKLDEINDNIQKSIQESEALIQFVEKEMKL